MGVTDRSRPGGIRNAFAAAHETDVDLPANEEPASGATAVGPYDVGEHGSIPRRGG